MFLLKSNSELRWCSVGIMMLEICRHSHIDRSTGVVEHYLSKSLSARRALNDPINSTKLYTANLVHRWAGGQRCVEAQPHRLKHTRRSIWSRPVSVCLCHFRILHHVHTHSLARTYFCDAREKIYGICVRKCKFCLPSTDDGDQMKNTNKPM